MTSNTFSRQIGKLKRWFVENKLIVILIVIGLLIRLIGINQVPSGDEIVWINIDLWDHWHPPLSIILHTIFRFLFGASVIVSRALIVCFSLANIFLVYLIASKIYNKKSALWASALMVLGVYPILSSLQIDIDGSILVFFNLLSLMFFLNYEDKNKLKWLILSGIGFGLGLLTKFTGVLLIGILGLYYLIKSKNIIKTVKVMFPVFIIGFAVFAIFPAFSYLTGSDMFAKNLAHLSRYTISSGTNLLLLLIQYLLPVIWLGPLFIGLFVLSLTRIGKKDTLPLVWIFVVVVVYTFINKDNFKPLDKYFMTLIPPLCFMIGNFLGSFKFKKKHVITFFVVLVISFISLFMLNSMNGEFVNFYPKTAYLQKATSFDWDFFLPITGSSGPIGFYLMFSTVAYTYIISTMLIIILFYLNFKKDKHWFKMLLLILLSVSFAYNIFLVQEFLFSSTTPSVNKISAEVLDYANENRLEKPIYVFRNVAFGYYLRERYDEIEMLDFDFEFDHNKINKLIDNPGSVIVVDFPTINKQSLLWESINRCVLLQSFENKDVKLGYVFDCTNVK